MPKPPAATTADYRKLLADIRREMERGLKKVEELLERQKVLSCWAIGRKINVYLNSRKMPPGAVGAFYGDLSRDLEMHGRTLQQCEQFFRYFPKFKPRKGLKWSHYRFLLTVPDAARRRAWVERIKKEGINTDQLRLMLMPPGAAGDLPEFDLKAPARGKLYTYRLLRADEIENFDVPWFVDLGFAGCVEAPASKAALDNKYIYTSEKADGSYRLKVTDAKASDLFTFRGKLRRLVDADTPILLIDQGFGKWIVQRQRLRRIAAEGLWLNGRMVEAGVAKVWRGSPPRP